MVNYWVTTDTHLGHKSIIDFCDRPLNYSDLIMDGLSVLQKDDVLIHLGDVSFRDGKEWNREYLSRIPGKAWLVKGNHDTYSYSWYLDVGWDWVGESMIMERFGKRIEFSHTPIVPHNSELQIHGHFHNCPKEYWEGWLKVILSSKHKLLALEFDGYKPVPLLKLVREREKSMAQGE